MGNPQRTLAIETATEACSIALIADGQSIAHEHRTIGRGHAEALIPMIASLPDKGRAERIVVSLGPGSFTGVRIGIAAARALGVAWKSKVLGYPTLALVAAMAQDEEARPVTVCMTGGHGEWFVQDFGSGLTPLTEMASLPPDKAARRHVQSLIAGTKASELAALHPLRAPEVLAIQPDARKLTELPPGLLREQVVPIYGRPPDAKPQPAKTSLSSAS